MTTTGKQPRCKATTKAGRSCESFAQGDNGFCYMHDPALAAERAESRRKGGKARHNRAIRHIPGDDPPTDITTIEDIRDLLAWGIADLLSMEKSIKRTNALNSLIRTAIDVVAQTELAERITALEDRLEASQDAIRSNGKWHALTND